MPVAAADDLFQAAVELRDACIDALTNEAPGGPITPVAIWAGPPSWDCVPAMYIHAGLGQVANTYPLQPPLQPMQRIATTGQVDLVTFTITVLRCMPMIEQRGQIAILPPVADIEAASKEIYGDLWAIWNHLKNEHRDGNLFQTPSGRREFQFDPAQAIQSSGGAGGWEIPVSVQLGGYATP